MKKITTILVATAISFASFGQKTEGVINFTENIDMTESIEKSNAQMDSAAAQNPERAGMMKGMKAKVAEMLKSMEKTYTTLTFKENISLYKEKPADLTEGEIHQEENFMMKMKPQPDIIYHNVNENQHYIQKDFMGKTFLIQDKVQNFKWKMIMEQKVILGYPCMKATKEDSLFKVEVWFTSQIPYSSGPKGLYGLPGMILEAKFMFQKADTAQKSGMMKMMNQFGTDISIKAEKIEFKEVSKKALKKPKDGEKVESESEYYALIFKKITAMQKMYGGKKGKHKGGFRMKMGN